MSVQMRRTHPTATLAALLMALSYICQTAGAQSPVAPAPALKPATVLPPSPAVPTTVQAGPQIQLPTDVKTLMAVERIEQEVGALDQRTVFLEQSLKIVLGKMEAVLEQNRQLADQLRVQTAQHRELPLAQRFEAVYSGDGILDKETGLLWTKGNPNAVDWNYADSSCRGAIVGGRGGWHLPTIQELSSLGPTPFRAPTLFTNGRGGYTYWSSTLTDHQRDIPIYAGVQFQTSSTSIVSQGAFPGEIGRHYYLCVRGTME